MKYCIPGEKMMRVLLTLLLGRWMMGGGRLLAGVCNGFFILVSAFIGRPLEVYDSCS